MAIFQKSQSSPQKKKRNYSISRNLQKREEASLPKHRKKQKDTPRHTPTGSFKMLEYLR